MTTVFHARLVDRFKEMKKNNIRRKKLQRINENSNFFKDTNSNIENVIALVQFIR